MKRGLKHIAHALSILLLTAACDDASSTGPVDSGAGVLFTSGSIAYGASGNPSVGGDGSILNDEFAVARADSVGGFAVISYDPTSTDQKTGNLFVLQAPRSTGTMQCGDNFGQQPCHGRYIVGITDGATTSFQKWYDIKQGSITVTAIGPDRLKASFSVVLGTQTGESIIVENGTIDVPYTAAALTDGALRCLIGLTGGESGNCRG